MFPTVGILFPDERLPGPRWRAPVAAGVIALGIGTVLQTIAPWRLEGDFTRPPTRSRIAGVPVELFELGGGLAAHGNRSSCSVSPPSRWSCACGARAGVEHAQQKWLVASVVAIAIAFPLSFATSFGPDASDRPAERGHRRPGADRGGHRHPPLPPVRDRPDRQPDDRRTVVITTLLVAAYAGSIVLLQGPLGTVTGGDTLAVALSTLAAAALFQPVRRRVQARGRPSLRPGAVRRRADVGAFADRLRGEVDIDAVTADLRTDVAAVVRPASGSGCGSGRLDDDRTPRALGRRDRVHRRLRAAPCRSCRPVTLTRPRCSCSGRRRRRRSRSGCSSVARAPRKPDRAAPPPGRGAAGARLRPERLRRCAGRPRRRHGPASTSSR